MEEKARIDGQETIGNEPKKPTYEQLMNAFVQTRQQNDQLQMQLRQINGIEKRLFYLFEVLKYADQFGDFAKDCVDEIKDILIIPKETEEPAPEEK